MTTNQLPHSEPGACGVSVDLGPLGAVALFTYLIDQPCSAYTKQHQHLLKIVSLTKDEYISNIHAPFSYGLVSTNYFIKYLSLTCCMFLPIYHFGAGQVMALQSFFLLPAASGNKVDESEKAL